MKWIVAIALVVAVTAVAVRVTQVAAAIQSQSTIDEARRADAIIVLGAAEYRGKPSPVLEARLNHALFLYLKRMAPRIITTGGAGGDPVFTEGSVGRSYLAEHGVPPEAIVVERAAAQVRGVLDHMEMSGESDPYALADRIAGESN